MSNLAIRYQDRFLGFGFLAAGYLIPMPTFNYEDLLATCNKTFGSDIYGYWEFFNLEDAGEIIQEHVKFSLRDVILLLISTLQIDSFLGILYPPNPEVWKVDFAPRGAIEKCVLSNKRYFLPPYLNEAVCRVN